MTFTSFAAACLRRALPLTVSSLAPRRCTLQLCLDVSDWMRNGDYTPTRIDAQYDAATMLCGAKIDSNPESTVGVLTSGGKG